MSPQLLGKGRNYLHLLRGRPFSLFWGGALNWEIRERALPVRHAKWSRQFDELEIV